MGKYNNKSINQIVIPFHPKSYKLFNQFLASFFGKQHYSVFYQMRNQR